jgi:HEAT repeat protein
MVNGDQQRLTTADRALGQRLLLRFFSLNGITVACLMDGVLILYAIRSGMSDALVAVLASFIQMTMPFMPIGYAMVRSFGLARTWAVCWTLRSMFAMTIVLSPWLVSRIGPTAGTGVILFGAFGFALFKAIGMVTVTPLIGEITTERERGRFMSDVFFRDHASYLVAAAAATLVIGLVHSIRIYQVVIVTGCVAGVFAARIVARVPETTGPRVSAAAPILDSLRVVGSHSDYRRMIGAWAAAFAGVALVLPVAFITVKNGYARPDSVALFLGLLVIVGGIGAARLGNVVSDHSGPRPLLLLYAILLLVTAVFWAAAPTGFSPYLVGLIFLISGAAKGGVIIETGHVLLRVTTQQDRVGVSLLTRMIAGGTAGFAGSVIAGTMLTVLADIGLTGLELYRWYFRAIIPFLLLFSLVVYRLPPVSGWRLNRLLRTLLRPDDMRALALVRRADRSSSFSQDIATARALAVNDSRISEKTIREYLQSPKLAVRFHALTALRTRTVGEQTIEAVRDQLINGEFTTAWVAAEVLGIHCVQKAIPDLRTALDSVDTFLQGKAMVALARIGDDDSLPRIRKILRTTTNPRTAIHSADALSIFGRGEDLVRILSRTADSTLPAQCLDELLAAAASIRGIDEWYYRLVRELSSRLTSLDSEMFQLLSAVPDNDARERLMSACRSGDDISIHDVVAIARLVACGQQEAFLDEFISNAGEKVPARVALFVMYSVTIAASRQSVGEQLIEPI